MTTKFLVLTCMDISGSYWPWIVETSKSLYLTQVLHLGDSTFLHRVQQWSQRTPRSRITTAVIHIPEWTTTSWGPWLICFPRLGNWNTDTISTSLLYTQLYIYNVAVSWRNLNSLFLHWFSLHLNILLDSIKGKVTWYPQTNKILQWTTTVRKEITCGWLAWTSVY